MFYFFLEWMFEPVNNLVILSTLFQKLPGRDLYLYILSWLQTLFMKSTCWSFASEHCTWWTEIIKLVYRIYFVIIFLFIIRYSRFCLMNLLIVMTQKTLMIVNSDAFIAHSSFKRDNGNNEVMLFCRKIKWCSRKFFSASIRTT